MGLSLVEAPALPPVSRDLVKQHLRVEHTDDDALIDTYIAAETAFAEDFTGRAFVVQTWDYFTDSFPAEGADPQYIRIPKANVLSVSGIFYQNGDSPDAELDAASYVTDLSGDYARVALAANGSWPTTSDVVNAVRIRFTAGSEDTGASPATPDVMKDIQLAIMLRVQADYDGGESAQGLRDASEIYLKRRRVTVSLG